MAFQTTAMYAIPLALIGLVLWFRVSMVRAELKVSIGDAGNSVLHTRIRQHGNFFECVPWVILLMALAEGNDAGALWLHIAGGLLLAGRLAHPLGLKADNAAHPLRYVGNTATLLATLTLIVCLVMTVFGL